VAVVFLLGPGMWTAEKTSRPERAPIEVRRRLGQILKEAGHSVVLMEDVPDQPGEGMVEKLVRILSNDVNEVLLYWPPKAKMQTTYDELLLLSERPALLRELRIRIWALHHATVARITNDDFQILETGQRSRYLTDVARLGLRPLEWETDKDLEEQVRLLAAELDP
jgi:hypothetical protein